MEGSLGQGGVKSNLVNGVKSILNFKTNLFLGD